VGGALGKIMRALPEPVAAQAEAVRRTIAPAPDRGAARPDPTTTATLVQACTSRRQVRIAYRSEAGSEWSSDVDPWAVVVRHGRWYLLCRLRSSGAHRAYRVDRVRDVTLLDGLFDQPPEFDPVTMLEEHLAVGWEYTVDVVIDAPLETVGRCLPRSLGRLEVISADSCRLVGTTSNPTWYAEQLATLSAPFRIIESAEIRAATESLGHRLLAAVAP
jgi:predicted DNA-binding transcriptional regulator YafY